MISGSILTTDCLTFPNFGQSENYCKKQKSSFRLAAETYRLAACAPQKRGRWKPIRHFNIIAAYGQSSSPLLAHRDEKSLRRLCTWLLLGMWSEKPGSG
jgi:hypothetical protein